MRLKEFPISGTRLSCVSLSGIGLAGIAPSGARTVSVVIVGTRISCIVTDETELPGSGPGDFFLGDDGESISPKDLWESSTG